MLDELAIEFASATAFVAALESPAAVCGRGTNAASPNIQTLPNAILGTDKSYIVCMKGPLVCATSCPKTVGRIRRLVASEIDSGTTVELDKEKLREN